MKQLPSSGIVAIWKPKGPSSFWVIQQIRKITGVKKVGHAGTLDPLAEGVLVVALGREYTKKIKEVVASEKEYVAKIFLGATSTTDDAEGEITKRENPIRPSKKDLEDNLKVFGGEVFQTPPNFSAIKIKGKRAYRLAREGKEPSLIPRKVVIKKIKLLSYSWPLVEIKVTTGPGTYIRSIARDLGEKLKTGAYLSGLIRTRVGQFSRKEALKMEWHPSEPRP